MLQCRRNTTGGEDERFRGRHNLLTSDDARRGSGLVAHDAGRLDRSTAALARPARQ